MGVCVVMTTIVADCTNHIWPWTASLLSTAGGVAGRRVRRLTVHVRDHSQQAI